MYTLSWQWDFTVPQDNFLQSLKRILIHFISSIETIQDELDVSPENKDLVMNSCEEG